MSEAQKSAHHGVMRVREFREELGGDIGVKRLYRYIQEGKLRHVQVGRRVLVLRSELKDFPERLAAEQELRA